MRKRDVLNSPRLKEIKKKRNKIFLLKSGGFFLVFLVLLVGFYFLYKWDRINIKNIEISGNILVEAEEIREKVNQELNGKYLFIFPKTNFTFYPKNQLKLILAESFPRLDEISISLKDISTLEIKVSERTGEHLWCGEDLEALKEKKEECYFMDKSGHIFDSAPYFSNDVYLKFFGELEESKTGILGSRFLPTIFSDLLVFKDKLLEMEAEPSLFLVKEDGDIEVYLVSNFSPPDSQKIIFRKDDNLEKIADNLNTALYTEPLKSDFREKYSSLLYIDLRFGNKVYFKFKE